MAYSLGAFAIREFAVQLNSLLLGEVLLLEFELCRQIEQTDLFLFFGDDIVEKSKVIPKEDDARSIIHWNVFAYITLIENRSHWRDIFVAKAKFRTGKAGITGFNRRNTWFAFFIQHVSSKDFFGHGHGAGFGFHRRQKHFFLHTRDIERKQAAILNHLAGNFIFPFSENTQRNFLSRADFIYQRKVSRSQ